MFASTYDDIDRKEEVSMIVRQYILKTNDGSKMQWLHTYSDEKTSDRRAR
jgi:hypothetical protein